MPRKVPGEGSSRGSRGLVAGGPYVNRSPGHRTPGETLPFPGLPSVPPWPPREPAADGCPEGR